MYRNGGRGSDGAVDNCAVSFRYLPTLCAVTHYTQYTTTTPAPEQLWSAVVAAKTTRKLCPGAIFFRPEVYESDVCVCVVCVWARVEVGGAPRLQKHLKHERQRQRRKESLCATNPIDSFFLCASPPPPPLFLHRTRFPPFLSLIFYTLLDQSNCTRTHTLQPF